jgi:hypothetical protein
MPSWMSAAKGSTWEYYFMKVVDLSAIREIEITHIWFDTNPTTVVENEPKTEASRRTLPLDEGLLGVLRRASARYAAEKLALGAAHADSGYVASDEAGQPYTPGALTHM